MPDEKTRYHFDRFPSKPEIFGNTTLIQIGRRWCEAGCVIGAHPHADWFELTIITAGEGSVITNGTAAKVTAGDIYFSFPYEVHDIHASPRDKLEYDYMAFRRTDERTSAALEHIRMDYAGADRRVFRDDRINTLVGMALPEFADPAELSDMVLNGLFDQIIVYLIRDFSKHPGGSADVSEAEVICALVMDYIDSHIGSIVNLSEAADALGYNYSYLSNLFKRTTGKNISEYYSDRRLGTAAAMLAEGKKNVGEIALKLGYSSGFALSRAFSGKYGCPPKSLIKKRAKSETGERKS